MMLEKHLLISEVLLLLLLFNVCLYLVGSCIIGFICLKNKLKWKQIVYNCSIHFIASYLLTIFLVYSHLATTVYQLFKFQNDLSIIDVGIFAEIITLLIHISVLRRKE